jgi:hypothetical protein
MLKGTTNYEYKNNTKLRLTINKHGTKINPKYLYWHFFTTMNQKPNNESKSNEKLDIMWNMIFTNAMIYKEHVLNVQHTIIAHSMLAYNYNLQICKETDDREHILVNCDKTKQNLAICF